MRGTRSGRRSKVGRASLERRQSSSQATIAWKLSRSTYDFVGCQRRSGGGCAVFTTKVSAPARASRDNKLTQNTDTLPAHLRIQLRANREDIILPDSHGQIWTELAALSSNNGQLFQGSNRSVEQEMLEHLRLSGRVKFPVRRLATLWRNLSWRPMITRWCRTSIGQATFNISTFEWMASCRIDDVSTICI